MFKTKTRYIYFALLANFLYSCSFLDLESSTPQAQLASFIEDSPSVYLSKPQTTKTLSRADRRIITRELANNDKAHREMLLAQQEAQQEAQTAAQIETRELPQISQIKTPNISTPHPAGAEDINTNFTTTGPQINTGGGINGVFSPPSESHETSPILNIADMRHPKTPGLNTPQEEESSANSSTAPRPNQAELRGLRSPQMKNAIPSPYKSN